MSFKLIHSLKYGFSSMPESRHCSGIFVFTSQFPLSFKSLAVREAACANSFLARISSTIVIDSTSTPHPLSSGLKTQKDRLCQQTLIGIVYIIARKGEIATSLSCSHNLYKAVESKLSSTHIPEESHLHA